MNKFFAQLIDRVAIDILSPRFHSTSSHREHNLQLLEGPPLPPRRVIKTPKLFLKKIKRKGSLDIYEYAFPSRVETEHVKNNTVFGRYYKLHGISPKSTVILLHGMYESRHWYQERHALNLAKHGHNCVIMTLPYHIERAPKGLASGGRFLTNDLGCSLEAIGQGVKDVLSLINWLSANGEKKLGLIGISLGGLIAGLAAATTRKVNYMVLVAPPVTPLQVTGHIKAGRPVEERIKASGLTKHQLFRLVEPWTLVRQRPLISPNRIFIIGAAHDAVVPGDSVEKVWHAWDNPRMAQYRHGHVSALASRRIFRDIATFLDDVCTPRKSAGLSK